MSKKLKSIHRHTIDMLFLANAFPRIARLLDRLSSRGFDVAGVPFSLLDRILGNDDITNIDALRPLEKYLLGGQPRLFLAIIGSIKLESSTLLREIVKDVNAHQQTRFEAMGWSTFLDNRATIPKIGQAIPEVFQYWDERNPPKEIQRATDNWRGIAQQYTLFNKDSAAEYIRERFGTNSAHDFVELWHPAIQSDVFRVYKLAADGGLYCDADSLPKKHSAKFLKCGGGSEIYASATTSMPNCPIINGFLAAPPKTKAMEGFLEYILKNIKTKNYRNIFWLSGPGALTHYFFQHEKSIHILPAQIMKTNLFSQIDADYKQSKKNWRVYEHSLGLNDDEPLKEILGNG